MDYSPNTLQIDVVDPWSKSNDCIWRLCVSSAWALEVSQKRRKKNTLSTDSFQNWLIWFLSGREKKILSYKIRKGVTYYSYRCFCVSWETLAALGISAVMVGEGQVAGSFMVLGEPHLCKYGGHVSLGQPHVSSAPGDSCLPRFFPSLCLRRHGIFRGLL